MTATGRLFPKTLTGRLIITSVIVLLAIQFIVITVYMIDLHRNFGRYNARLTLLRLASTVKVLDHNDPSIYHDFIRTRLSRNLFVNISGNPVVPAARSAKFEELIKTELEDGEREVFVTATPDFDLSGAGAEIPRDGDGSGFRPLGANRDPAPRADRPALPAEVLSDIPVIRNNNPFDGVILPAEDPSGMTPMAYGSVRLASGCYLTFVNYKNNILLPRMSYLTLYFITFTAVAGTLLFYWLFTRMTRPLKDLMRQAEKLSSDYKTAPLKAAGPKEIQDLQHSFNRMQENLVSFIDDRTRILASISHDLKTPLTSLRLRTEFLEDSEDTRKIRDTVDVMTRMVKATLLFARGDEQTEEAREIHLPSLVESICSNYLDAGRDIAYAEKGDVRNARSFFCSSTDMHRILQNLIDNAFQHGRKVTVTLAETPEKITLSVADDGPGIPEDKLEEVFAPFTRLDQARNTENAHVGLGLSIVRNTVLKQGGSIVLRNVAPHGLEALITYDNKKL